MHTQARKALALDTEKLFGIQVTVQEVPPSALTLTVETGASSVEAKPTIVVQNPVPISCFSGEAKPKGGEVCFESWKYEVACLTKDEACPADALARLVRRSLRGEAAQIILSMGPEVTAQEIVTKLEGFYRTLESGAVLLKQLYCSRQAAGEPVASYSARLQLSIDCIFFLSISSPDLKRLPVIPDCGIAWDVIVNLQSPSTINRDISKRSRKVSINATFSHLVLNFKSTNGLQIVMEKPVQIRVVPYRHLLTYL